MLNNLVEKLYKKLRGHELDATSLPLSVLRTIASQKAGELIRGSLYRGTYRSVAGMHFRGKGVSVRNPRFLRLGSSVVFGPGVQIDAYSINGITLGSRVTVGRDANLVGTAVVREVGIGIAVGNDTAIGNSCIIWGQGGVRIGDHCLLGPHVSIFSENHEYSDPNLVIRLQGTRRQATVVEDDCWIGAGAKILAGVVIGRGSVVAAGAVVTHSVEPFSVVGGVPAKTIGFRQNAEANEDSND